MKISYKLQDKFDLWIFIPVLLLLGISLVVIYSATTNHPFASGSFDKQFFWALISLGAFFVFYLLPSQLIRLSAVPAYVISQFLLIAVLVAGKVVKGSKSWIAVGSIGFQPSEAAKIGLILFLAYWLVAKKDELNTFKNLTVTILFAFIPTALILLEPDTGTAIVFGFISLVMIYWGGISLFGLFVVLSPVIVVFSSLFGIYALIGTLTLILIALIFFNKDLFTSVSVFVFNLAAGFIFEIVVKFLQPHQQKRIASFLDPTADPLGSGYNALQAKIAIGSGGLIGKGFMQGNQTQLRFIPEQWTDFIYCVIGEEFGFIGGLFVLSLYLIILLRLLIISKNINDDFSTLVVIGVFALFFIQLGINVGMNIGIAPVIGLTLPLLSYGGSSLFASMILLGIVFNIYRNKRLHS